jgi:hypothetical protein
MNLQYYCTRHHRGEPGFRWKTKDHFDVLVALAKSMDYEEFDEKLEALAAIVPNGKTKTDKFPCPCDRPCPKSDNNRD